MKDAATWQVRYAIVVGIVMAALGLLALGASSLLVGVPPAGDVRGIAYYLLPFGVVALLSAIVRPTGAFINFGRHPAAAFRYGWYLLMIALILGVLSFLSIGEERFVTPSWQVVAIYLVVTCLTASFEELLCRGLIQNLIVARFAATKGGPWRAIVISSLIFAVLHFANLTAKPWFVIGTLTQVIYTLCVGIVVGTIYYLTGDLLAAILVHAAFNFCGQIAMIFQPVGAPLHEDLPIAGAIIQLVLLLPAIVVARRLYLRHANQVDS